MGANSPSISPLQSVRAAWLDDDVMPPVAPPRPLKMSDGTGQPSHTAEPAAGAWLAWPLE